MLHFRHSGSPDYLVITWDRVRMQPGDAHAVYRDQRLAACRSMIVSRRILLNRMGTSRLKLALHQPSR